MMTDIAIVVTVIMVTCVCSHGGDTDNADRCSHDGDNDNADRFNSGGDNDNYIIEHSSSEPQQIIMCNHTLGLTTVISGAWGNIGWKYNDGHGDKCVIHLVPVGTIIKVHLPTTSALV